MKVLILMLIYLGTFTFFFFALSTFGIFWSSYSETLSNKNWFVVYTMFLGWWIACLPAREYYVNNEEDLHHIF